MQLYDNIWHIISAIIIFIFGLFLALILSNIFKIKKSISLSLYLWHTLFCFVFIRFAMFNSADANRYFNSLNYNYSEFKFGTVAVEQLTSLLRLFDLSYMGCFLIFNIIGTIGLISIYGAINTVTKNSSRKSRLMGVIFVFLPSVSFWSSAIGKDAISFMAIGLVLWASLNFKRRKGLFFFAIISMLFVRPHMAGIMIIAISISLAFDKNVNLNAKIILIILSLSASSIMVPFAFSYAGMDDNVTSDSLGNYITSRQNSNLEGGSSVDIESMPLPIQMFTYLFRPLPYEAKSITTFFASLDNMLLFLIILLGIKKIRKYKPDGSNRVFLWTYSFGSLLILSLTTANLGIAMRQKWMFVPIIAYLFISALAQRKNFHKVTYNK